VCGISTDITARKRAENRLAVQYALTRVLAESDTLEAATPQILQTICEHVGWELGALWIVDRQSKVLRFVDWWHTPSLQVPKFEEKTRQMTFACGVGLPGRVWASGKPAWIDDVVKDANFPRAQVAETEGLHGAFAFPILLGHEIHGIVEFFSREVRKPEEDMLEMFAAVGSQIGQFVERRRVREALGRERDLLQALMDNVPDTIYFKDTASRFTRINKAQARLLGVPDPRDAIGKTDFDYFTHAPEAFADEQQILKSGKALIGKVEKIRNAEGQQRYVSSTKAPLFDKDGKPIGIVGITRDITEIEQAREQLSRYAEEMRKKNEQMEADLDMARGIQQVMLPKQFSSFPRGAVGKDVSLRFSHRYWPVTKLGGDFFDMLPVSSTEAGVFICDVMGHGVRSALVTAMMRALVEEQSPVMTDPGKFLAKVNQVLLGILRQADVPTFASAFYLVADVARGEVRYANAGHPTPFHLRRSLGAVEPLSDGQAGPALGLFAEAVYPSYSRRLAINDLVMLFTDGLFEVEGANKEYYGQERLLEAVRKRITTPSPKLFADLLTEIPQFSITGNFTDDVCVVGMEVARIG
jgi:sigma-B regulation protein RsbU (phosphoserine phosphatase)